MLCETFAPREVQVLLHVLRKGDFYQVAVTNLKRFGNVRWDGVRWDLNHRNSHMKGDPNRLDATGQYVTCPCCPKQDSGKKVASAWTFAPHSLEGYGMVWCSPSTSHPGSTAPPAVSWYFSSKVSASGKCGMPSGPALKTWRSQGGVMQKEERLGPNWWMVKSIFVNVG